MKNYLSVLLTVCLLLYHNSTSAQTTTTTFTADDLIMISNPDRGFTACVYPTWTEPPTPMRAVTQADCDRAISKKYSVISLRYVLWPWKNSDLPVSFLNQVAQDCNIARQNGLKLLIEFSYIYATNGGTNAYYDGISDAPESIVLKHIDQLTTNLGTNNGPLLVNNDVVSMWRVGFIGSWGEEHHSSNNLLLQPLANDPDPYNRLNAASYNIWNALLNKIPTNRMIATRYCAFKKQFFNNATLSNITTSNIGRIGIHDDSFSANVDNYGSYQFYVDNGARVQPLRDYTSNETKYTVSYGETYGAGPETKQQDGNTVISEMKIFHLDFYNGEFDQLAAYAETYDKWQQQGLLDKMKNFVGYRLNLISSNAPTTMNPGQNGVLNFKIENRGWGKLFNPRPVNLLICRKNGNGGYAEKYVVNTTINPRLWYAGTQKDETITFSIPSNAPAGNYDLLLELPDEYASLATNSAYSVRLATKIGNSDIWSAGLGANWIANLQVTNTLGIINTTISESAVKLYPNPATKNITLEYNLLENGIVNVSIYDFLGKEVTKMSNENRNSGNQRLDINTSNLQKGIYFVKINANNYTVTKKLIIE